MTLEGAHVRLEPLSAAHLDGLREAVRDGRVWELTYTNVPAPDAMLEEIERRLTLARAGSMLPFTVFDPREQTIAGMTTYMNVDAERRRLEIGSTWYARRVRRTPLNTQAKLLLLAHAFERLDCMAVEFRTSALNLQSRAAIERLGAHLDGILRHHGRHADGSPRDTFVYSIIAPEWPAIRAGLLRKLSRDPAADTLRTACARDARANVDRSG